MSTKATAGLGAALTSGSDRRAKAGDTSGPASKTVMASARVPEDVWKAIKIRAVTEGVPAQVIVTRAFEHFLETA
jgi:hypothetical protein